MAPERVSLVVRTMGRPVLANALGAIVAQTHRPLEVVLVDAAASGIEWTPPPGVSLRTVRQGRLERPHAANAGLDAATGDWIGFLDEDDLIEPGHIAGLLAAASAAAAPVAYSQTRLVDGCGTQRVFGGPFNRAALFRSNYLSIHAVIFRRALVAQGCRFDESFAMFEDWDFWLQLAMRAPFAFTRQPTAIYRSDAGASGAGSGTNLDRAAVLAQRERLMRKWDAARLALETLG